MVAGVGATLEHRHQPEIWLNDTTPSWHFVPATIHVHAAAGDHRGERHRHAYSEGDEHRKRKPHGVLLVWVFGLA